MTLRRLSITTIVFIMTLPTTLPAQEPENDATARAFIAKHESRIGPLERSANLAWWNANVSGKDADFKAKEDAQNRLDLALSDHNAFNSLKALKHGKIDDPIVAREVDGALLDVPRKAGRPLASPADHRQGQRRREGVQRLPGQGRRQGDDR